MATKEDLVRNIKGWMEAEDEVKALTKALKERRALKKQYSDALVEIMKTNEIDCFDMNEGRIVYTRNKVKAPLSKKHLLECLAKYASANPECNLPAEDVGQFIMDSRASKTKELIRHRPGKNV